LNGLCLNNKFDITIKEGGGMFRNKVEDKNLLPESSPFRVSPSQTPSNQLENFYTGLVAHKLVTGVEPQHLIIEDGVDPDLLEEAQVKVRNSGRRI
jgi:hypothetical protein